MGSKIFSLEIFIDRIRLAAGEKCFLPSTILKFLSYEPALISCIDKNVQDNLREYISLVEKNGKLIQIEQLKDSDGNYIIRKGKSILFESNAVSLMNELNVLPLYILVTDDYFNPTHLVGVVAINLSSVMCRLAQKITKNPITVSEETGGKFPIVNLMGNGIGAISLSLRLIYIGENIGRHMAEVQELELRPNVIELRETCQKSVGDELPMRLIDKNCSSPQPVTTMVRNIGCQADEKRSFNIQVPPKSNNSSSDRKARIGLTIDPNDPLLEGPPPLIYNSHFDGDRNHFEDYVSDNDDKKPPQYKDSSTTCTGTTNILRLTNNNKNMPILNALFSELKAWKSEDFVEESTTTHSKPKVTNRSKSVDVRPPININPSEFLRRMAKPKVRPVSPNGKVPKNLGWIRTEPQFSGPKRSCLEYKLTKTQLRRIELKNPKLYDRILSNCYGQLSVNSEVLSPSKRSVHDKQIIPRLDNSATVDNSATTYTELPEKHRHPLVPPLFNPGTSISVPTFTQTDSSSSVQYRRGIDSEERNYGLPPKLPDRLRNSVSQTMSFETNATIEEADHILNLNPVQSNRSPQMTLRSQATLIDKEEEDEEEYEDDDSIENRQRQYAYNNRSDEYSDDFNGSFSSSNGPASLSRRFSNASQISQTSEWRTEYSRGSSVTQNYLNRQDSPPQSPNNGSYQSPQKNSIKSRRSLLANGVAPGSRFSDLNSSRQIRSSESFAASFDEAAERTNYTDSGSVNRGEETIRSMDQTGGLIMRPTSAGADVTSFTKVTKFDRSLAPGRQSNNYLGTNYLASTVASMQTDDSQMLTSDSFS